MEDHDHGGALPAAATRDEALADRLAGGPRRRELALAARPSGDGADLPRSDPKPKKKRKRKRGRNRVFARDTRSRLPANGAGAPSGDPRPDNPMEQGAPRAVEDAGSRYPRHGRPPRAADVPAYAALDLGTNNCRLLVALPTYPGRFRVVDAYSRIVRLGEGLAASGRLSDAAMERALEALRVCADKLGSRKLKRTRLIATEACRSAENGPEFLARVREETGLALDVIDRSTEARLAVSGCGTLVERGTQGVVLFDIGGGSSEIALVDVSRHRTPRLADHIVSWTSLPLGVVSLAERFGGREVTPEIFSAMVDEVTARLAAFDGSSRLAHLVDGEHFHLLGTSGTVTTLAGVHLDLERYDRRRVDGLWMDNGDVDRMIAKLLSWSFEERVANPCIGADRADLVLAGCAILEAIRRQWPSPRLRVADRGLREGMLSEMMAEDGVWRRRRRRGPRPS